MYMSILQLLTSPCACYHRPRINFLELLHCSGPHANEFATFYPAFYERLQDAGVIIQVPLLAASL